MELFLPSNCIFEINILVENFLDRESEIGLYVHLNQLFRAYSFNSKFLIKDHNPYNFKIIPTVEIPIKYESTTEKRPLGNISIYLDRKLFGSFKLPFFSITTENDNYHYSLGIRILLHKPKIRAIFRARKLAEKLL